MLDFRIPLNCLSAMSGAWGKVVSHLGLDVVERGRANDRKADEEYVGLRV